MTVSSVLQGHILWSKIYGHTYGPDKLSVLAARKATSRMPGPEMSRNRTISEKIIPSLAGYRHVHIEKWLDLSLEIFKS